MPIILRTAKGAEADIVSGLNAGAIGNSNYLAGHCFGIDPQGKEQDESGQHGGVL
jgi:hypothetical protein